jgi:transposase
MSTVADSFEVVIGTDTHAETHSYAVCNSTGGVLAEATFATTPKGLAQALALAADHAGDPAGVVFAVEGTRSYGIALMRAAQAAGYVVAEAEQPSGKVRRGKGKSDPIDARLAARNLLDYDVAALATPRADGPRAGLAVLLNARRDMSDERTAKINQLKALLRGGNPTEHALAAGDMTIAKLNQIARRRGQHHDGIEQALRRAQARRLALRIGVLGRDLKDNKKHLTGLVDSLVPALIEQPGIGPVSAAQAIVSYSHHGRCRSEGSYANLAGAAPLDASSGKQQRHRLNRGGDRDLVSRQVPGRIFSV